MRVVILKDKKYIVMGILSLFLLFGLSNSIVLAQQTVVSISPSTQTVSQGQTFTINITIDPYTDIAGAQFDLSFNSSLVSANSVVEGNLLKQDGASTYFRPGTIDNTAGTITGVACAITTPGETVSSPGVFATIQMNSKSVEGRTSALDLSNVIVGDINGNPVSITVNNGNVTVGATNVEQQMIEKGNELIISKVGDEHFNNYMKLLSIEYQSPNEVIEKPYYLLTYTFKIPEKQFVNESIEIGINVDGNIVREWGIPNNPKECEFPIDEAKAIEIARDAGLEEGIKEWESDFYWHGGDLKTYVWAVRNILSTEPHEESGKLVIIDANSGEVKEFLGWSKFSTPPNRPNYTGKCAQLKDLIEEKKHYEHLYNLSDKLKKKGYTKPKEHFKKILEKYEERIRECEEITARSGGRKGQGVNVSQERYPVVKPSNVSITKPIVAESGREITDYYTSKITTIMKKETNVEQQVKELKELRNEVDELIEELIKSKDEITTEEVDELVTKLKIKPGKIKADNAIINSTNKTIITKVNKKNLTIKLTKLHVTIQEGKYEIKVPEIKVQNKTLVVGNSTVKLRVSDIVEKTKVEPKDIELKEENAKAVYKIKADENRKLFGFIPVKVEKDMTVDAGDREVKVLKEKRPWWSFLTIK